MRIVYVLIVTGLALGATQAQAAECDSSVPLEVLRARFFGVESPIAVAAAEEHMSTLDLPASPCEQQAIKYEFIGEFFRGFRESGAAQSAEPPNCGPDCAGLRAGWKFRIEHPDKVDQVYSSFGFTLVELVGTLEARFEVSRFSPTDAYVGEDWWFEVLPGAKQDFTAAGTRIVTWLARIKGYASPLGRHGHLGRYDRRVYVHELRILPIQ
jgi:hypothetical protein